MDRISLPAYTTRRFLALMGLSVLFGVLVTGGTVTSVHYLYPPIPQPDFSIACCWPINDGTLLLSSGPAYNSSYNSWITLSSLNQFTGTIVLKANLPLPVSVNPSIVTLTNGGRIQASLTVSVSSSTPLGVYTGTLTGTSGSLVRSVPITVNVVSTPPDFAFTASSSSIGIPVGSSTSATVQIRSLNGFTGTIILTATVSPRGLPVNVNPASITLVSGAVATSTISFGPMPSAVPVSEFSILVNATGAGIDHSVAIHVTTGQAGPDFSIACCWPSFDGNVSVASGSTYSSFAKLQALNNFTGTVTLTVNLSLPGTVYPSTLIFPIGITATTPAEPTVTISVPANTSPGLYIGNLEASSGSLIHFALLSVSVAAANSDFGISSSQSLLLVPGGFTNTSSIGLWSVSGFSGTITLSISASPDFTAGSNASLKPVNVTLTANGAVSSVLTISAASTAASGNYTLLITASYKASPTGPSVSHSIAIGVVVFGKTG